MTPRWDWSWEETAGGGNAAESGLHVPAWLTAPKSVDEDDPLAQAVFRRRRWTAVVAFALMLVALVAVVSAVAAGRAGRAVPAVVPPAVRVLRPDDVSGAAPPAHADGALVDRRRRLPAARSGGDRPERPFRRPPRCDHPHARRRRRSLADDRRAARDRARPARPR